MNTSPSFADTLQGLQTPAAKLCVGIDPHPHILEAWGLHDTAAGALDMGRIIVDQIINAGVSIIKPQVAFFERHGSAGMGSLATLIQEARGRGLTVIADAKRGDVGSTVSAYADAWLASGSDLEADALTAVAFQGVGSIEPMCEAAEHHGKGLFVLVNTSNPDGWELQAARVSTGQTLAQHLFDNLASRRDASASTDWLGAVIGATMGPDERSVDPGDGRGLWILAPGFGAQGATLSQLTSIFGAAAPRVIPTVSRSVTRGGPDHVASLIAKHLQELGS